MYLCFGVALIMFSWQHKSERGIREIGIGEVLMGLGCILIALRGSIADFLSIVVANSTIYASVAILSLGILRFYRAPERLLVYAIAPLIALCCFGHAFYTYADDNVTIRILFFALCVFATSAITLRGLFSVASDQRNVGLQLVRGLFFSVFLYYSFKILSISLPDSFTNTFNLTQVDTPALVFINLQLFLLTAVIVWTATDRIQRKLVRLSQVDPLTGTLNRRALEDRLQQEFERLERYHGKMALVMADLDYFKRINDLHGHATGDKALIVFANTLQSRARSADIVARYGGEEFVIVLPESDSDAARKYASDVAQSLSSTHIPPLESPPTVSFGISEHKPGQNWEKLLDEADDALYTAKRAGRNRIVVQSEKV